MKEALRRASRTGGSREPRERAICPRCSGPMIAGPRGESLEYACVECGFHADAGTAVHARRITAHVSPTDELRKAMGIRLERGLDAAEEAGREAGHLRVVASGQGISVDRRHASYAVVLGNTHPNLACEHNTCEVCLYDASGSLLTADRELVCLVLPGQTVAVASRVPAAGVHAARLEVHLSAGSTSEAGGIPALVPVEARYTQDGTRARVLAAVRNPYPLALGAVYLATVLYDESGAIVGGHSSFWELLPPLSETEVSVALDAPAEQPRRAIVYPNLSALSLLRLQQREGEGEASSAMG